MKTRSIHPADLLQVPTAISIASLELVREGCRDIDTPSGKVKIALGRTGDLLDGYVARRFNMSSDAGAIADATCDKVGMAMVGAAAWQHNIVPKSIIATMVARNIFNTGMTFHNGLNDPDKRAIRPPKSGKYAMAADNLAFGAFMLADELEQGSTSYRVARGVGYAAAAAGLAFGVIAAKHYAQSDFDTV